METSEIEGERKKFMGPSTAWKMWSCFRLSGRKIRRSLGTDNKKLAEVIEAKLRMEIIEARFLDKLSTRNFKEFMDLPLP